jgi:hypothetical protein
MGAGLGWATTGAQFYFLPPIQWRLKHDERVVIAPAVLPPLKGPRVKAAMRIGPHCELGHPRLVATFRLAGEVANPTAQHRAEQLVSVSEGQHNRTKKPRSAEERAVLSGTLAGQCFLIRRSAGVARLHNRAHIEWMGGLRTGNPGGSHLRGPKRFRTCLGHSVSRPSIMSAMRHWFHW